ncbi:ATP-dependent RNA helicase DbpA [invertebrate metagenome]|uniref:ATP-dependent RNA helicase DbpA n=1 Tax=invertebrate metagenome TaxID=1711999 RepID=A0A2H9TAL7_9ZZZZ
MNPTDFSQLPLSPAFIKNLKELGYLQMTPIQQHSLPITLAGQDIIAQAKTGSGKTVAFGISLLTKIRQKFFGCQCLILSPTRELASQTAKAVRQLARYQQNIKIITLCGGQPIGPQIRSLEHGAHIIVGTPGRIGDHLHKETLDLSQVSTLVLDEADRMLDMGFIHDITKIIQYVPEQRQTLLFSATYTKSIKEISRSFQRSPEEVIIEGDTKPDIHQQFFLTDKSKKTDKLLQILQDYRPDSSIVFCNTKKTCQDIFDYLNNHGCRALMLHGDLEQKERDQILIQFSNKSASLLIATDVAARGLDINNLSAVINYDLTSNHETYTHRIGRTGRAGKKGIALSLYTESEQYKVDKICRFLDQSIPSEAECILSPRIPTKDRQLPLPPMVTFIIDGGKKQKLRPGDILGALTGKSGIAGNHVGKIDILYFTAYVAINRSVASKALSCLQSNIKGRKFKVRQLA